MRRCVRFPDLADVGLEHAEHRVYRVPLALQAHRLARIERHVDVGPDHLHIAVAELGNVARAGGCHPGQRDQCRHSWRRSVAGCHNLLERCCLGLRHWFLENLGIHCSLEHGPRRVVLQEDGVRDAREVHW